MEKEFVPYNLAVVLAALGFNEICFGCYIIKNKSLMITGSTDKVLPKTPYILAPTYSQVLRWFRDVHNLHGHVKPLNHDDYEVRIHCPHENKELWEQWGRLPYDSHEEAEYECVEKLIDIYNEKNA